MAEGGPPTPIAEGNLAARPFAHVLLHVARETLTGTLVVWPEQTGDASRGQDRILVRQGRLLAARFIAQAADLARGMLPLFTRSSPYAFYDVNLVGAGDGVVTGEVDPIRLITASLRGAAREDAVAAVLARFGDTKLRLTPRVALDRYGFDAKETAFLDLLRAAPDSVDILCATWGNEKQARRLLYLLAITKCVEPWTGAKKRTTGGAAVRELEKKRSSQNIEPSASPLLSEAQQAVEPTRERAAADDDDFGEVPPERPSLGPAAAPEPAKPAAPSKVSPPSPKGPHAPKKAKQADGPPPAPADLAPEHAKLWQDIALRAERLDTMNYYEMLGVARDCSANDVRDAYFALAKKWHPDRLPAELAPLRPWVDVIFHHATQARDTLSDEPKRAEYLRSVQAGGGTPEADRKLNAIVTAAMAVQKVEVLVRRREWLESLSLLREAIELNPEDSDAHAMQGWVLYQMGSAANKIDFDAVHKALDRAIQLNERNARAHSFKAAALKRQNKHGMALAHFRKVVELDPKNIDAAREVRLAEMREGKKPGGRPSGRPSKPPSGGDGGLLGKLFGGKKK